MTLRIMKRAVMLLLVLWNSVSVVHADEFQVVLGDQFLPTLQKLLPIFEKETGHKAIVIPSSTGLLYAKVKEGAPFDVFLSADVTTPLKMEQEGLAVPNSRFSYAVGKLVLWSPNPNLVDKKGEVLKKANFNHIVFPHPERAPYGIVVKQTLEKLGVWNSLQDKIIIVESPMPAHKLIVEGGAELGFLPLSVLNPLRKIEGSLWIVPANLYERLEHQAVLLKHGENNAAAKDFLVFLKSSRARNVIESFGYSLP